VTHSIRRATQDDLPTLSGWTLALQHYEAEHGRAMLPVVDDLPVHLQKWIHDLLSTPNALLLVAEQGSAPLGFALGFLHTQPNPFTPFQSHGVIQLLWVDDEWRGQGIARDLVGQLVAVFKDAGAGYIEVQHIAANVPAASFWQDAGFDVCGVTRRKFL